MAVVIAIDPGHGMGAEEPGRLDEGVVAWWQGVRITEQALALAYAVALDETLRDRKVHAVLTRDDSLKDCSPQHRVTVVQAARADLVIGLHFLGSSVPGDRGLQIVAEGPAASLLAERLVDGLSGLLPCRAGPLAGCSGLSVDYGVPQVQVWLGNLQSGLDLELITDATWKIRVCEALAAAIQTHIARRATKWMHKRESNWRSNAGFVWA
jgi:N-acetylmuramoyl-L-alanine amidase